MVRAGLAGLAFALFGACAFARELPLELIRLPEGFTVEVYACGVANAREMALGARGTLFVGSRSLVSASLRESVVSPSR